MDELLSSKIAAGEVVERPASIVKELMENSVDAGATSLSVHIVEGGKRLVRVTDDGSGISFEDAPLSFVRHATSKLSTDEDLDAINTMGFRGEALSSIAAVSKVTLKTRTREEIEGTLVRSYGGDGPEVTRAGCAPGTDIEVAELFFNTPARAKFLRTPGTEFGRITDIFKKIALAYPERRFTLTHGQSTTLETHPGTLLDRVADIFGGAIARELLEIHPVEMPDGLKVTGFTGRPTLNYPTGKGLFIYINHRPLRDPGITRAVLNGYSSLIDRGRYPFTVLFIEMNPAEVDVNVHPAKNEVRLKNPGYIFDTVRTAVNRTLASATPGASHAGIATPAEKMAIYNTYPTPGGRRAEGGASENISEWRGGAPSTEREQLERQWRDRAGEGGLHGSGGMKGKPSYNLNKTPVEGVSEGLSLTKTSEDTVNPEFLELDVTGQLFGEFLVCESWRGGGALILIDQHAAAERVRFERLKQELAGSSVKSQLLLIPERLETTPEEKDALTGVIPELKKLGFEIIPFGQSLKRGGESFIIKSVPELLSGKSSAPLIADLAIELAEHSSSVRIEERMEEILMRIACHSVIRGRRALTDTEARSLLKDLSEIDFAAHCPHGRPVVKRLKRGEIDAFFKRS